MAWLESANGNLASGDTWVVTDAHYRKDSIYYATNRKDGEDVPTRFVEKWKKFRVESKQSGVYDYESADAIAKALAEQSENSQVQVVRANDSGGYRVAMTTETEESSGENDPLDDPTNSESDIPGANTGGGSLGT